MVGIKHLPIFTPKKQTYPGFTNILSILNHSNEYLPWYYSNTIQLSCRHNDITGGVFVFFHHPQPIMYDCPWIDWQKISIKFIKQLSGFNIINFLSKSIDNDMYALLKLNTLYINEYSYTDEHDAFISGYDNIKKEFILSDFFGNGKYYTASVSFSEVEEGFKNLFGKYPKNNNISLFRLIQSDYKFDIIYIIKGFAEYLSGRPSGFNSPDSLYGVDIYPALITYLEITMRDCREIDLLPFHTLYEHKKCMYERLTFLFENKHINQIDYEMFISRFIEVMKIAEIVKNSVIKYMYTGNVRLIENIIIKVNKIFIDERNLLKDFLDKLNESIS